jgi:phage tail-like protein
MAKLRERPYVQFNFLIDFGAGAPGMHGGFQELTGIGTDKDPVHYERAGKKALNVEKITGINKALDVILKRGVVDASALDEWLKEVREGAPRALRTVTITLQDEHHEPVQSWKLLRARIIKHTSGPLNAKGTDVAMEELTLAYERLEME